MCVIDAVFSIGVRYEGVRRVVDRYCQYFSLPKVRADKHQLPNPSDQKSVDDFVSGSTTSAWPR